MIRRKDKAKGSTYVGSLRRTYQSPLSILYGQIRGLNRRISQAIILVYPMAVNFMMQKKRGKIKCECLCS